MWMSQPSTRYILQSSMIASGQSQATSQKAHAAGSACMLTLQSASHASLSPVQGYHGDLNETYIVGEVDEESKKLTKVAYEVETGCCVLLNCYSHRAASCC